jgi:hypothetical protein
MAWLKNPTSAMPSLSGAHAAPAAPIMHAEPGAPPQGPNKAAQGDPADRPPG